MELVLFLAGLIAFATWLLKQPKSKQWTSLGIMCGSMFLYGSFIQYLHLASIYRIAVFFLAILTSVVLTRLDSHQRS
ncbi:hypothetical protein KW791_03880 [Candidatus Parcubacteria bacterium]|nr:hypothetical protein [Candidatus Parcubacteria bacterium]